MDKYIGKAKTKLHGFIHEHDSPASASRHGPPPVPPKPISSQPDRPSSIQPPTPLDVLRYRYHHGTNLGAVYVLEKWLFPAMFPAKCGNGKSSELEGVKACVEELGTDGARERFEKHWADALTDGDLEWLVGVARCTTIRLPIGYFTLGPSFCTNTPFAPYASIYTNAWRSVQQLTQRAHARGIGILLDFHGLPGGANGSEHSGTNSGCAEHWKSHGNRNLSTRCLEHMATEVRDSYTSDAAHPRFGDGVAGIQLCNEADWEAPGLYQWYDGAIAAVHSVDPGMPIYISDAWNVGRALDYCARKNSIGVNAPTGPVIVDTHLYWAFTEADKKKSPQQVVGEARGKLGQLDGREGDVLKKGAVAAVVGEYSCVLAEESWKRRGGQSKEELVREFGQALSQRFQQRTMGSFFWTYKMQWMPGGEWGFKNCTSNGAITPPWTLTLAPGDVSARLATALSQRDARLSQTVAGHSSYWDGTAPGTPFEHWRFEAGWKVGFDDAAAFFGMRVNGGLGGGGGGGGGGGDKIGNLEVWVRKRVLESGMGGAYVWEFEQGVRKGVGEFCELAGGL